ncbi:MAG: phosphotransferase [Gammaproteobacteria bacterium]|nr:phosphotransferase [Gammaproteobacteria bacterium]
MTTRIETLHNWLENEIELGNYSLTVASADASFRRYFRLVHQGETYIVMDAPPQHEDCWAFIDISTRLLECGLNVPVVYEQNLEDGFLLLSDLGEDLFLDNLNDSNADELYKSAIHSLLTMQTQARVAGLPAYDESLLFSEMQLFRDWLLNKHLQIDLGKEENRQLDTVFAILSTSALQQQQVFVHRDFHSRNLLVNEGGPGIIDYQDAVLGPLSYDLVSLLKDCYIKWPRHKIDEWLAYYLQQNEELKLLGPVMPELIKDFDLMGVQRHLKASGIFARLYLRDGKDGYLADIPRTLSYIIDLEQDYPELGFLTTLIRTRVLPALEAK